MDKQDYKNSIKDNIVKQPTSKISEKTFKKYSTNEINLNNNKSTEKILNFRNQIEKEVSKTNIHSIPNNKTNGSELSNKNTLKGLRKIKTISKALSTSKPSYLFSNSKKDNFLENIKNIRNNNIDNKKNSPEESRKSFEKTDINYDIKNNEFKIKDNKKLVINVKKSLKIPFNTPIKLINLKSNDKTMAKFVTSEKLINCNMSNDTSIAHSLKKIEYSIPTQVNKKISNDMINSINNKNNTIKTCTKNVNIYNHMNNSNVVTKKKDNNLHSNSKIRPEEEDIEEEFVVIKAEGKYINKIYNIRI